MAHAHSVTVGTTIGEARRLLASRFREAEIESAEIDARVLLQWLLGLDRAALLREDARRLTPAETDALEAAALRRLAREPIAHITGQREFWSLPLRVTPATLIPRPETETIVEAALGVMTPERRNAPLTIADIGTGSGAILLALLTELPNAFGVGTDISIAALEVASSNAARLGLADRAAFIACDFADALRPGFDLIVSNPPYIATSEIADLMPEVARYEPRSALDGGADGLDAYRRLAGISVLLKPSGALILEVGQHQAEPVRTIFFHAGWNATATPLVDLAGIPRTLILRPVRP